MKLYFSFIFILIQSIAASAVEYKGKMRCSIVYQQLVELADGRPQTYSGYKDKYALGDELILSYKYSRFGESGYEISLALKDEARDHTVDYASFYGDVGEGARVLPSGNVTFWKTYDYPGGPSISNTLGFSDDHIWVDQLGEMYFERYYKSDFHGIIKPLSDHDTSHIIMVDCRTEIDARNAIREDLIRSNN